MKGICLFSNFLVTFRLHATEELRLFSNATFGWFSIVALAAPQLPQPNSSQCETAFGAATAGFEL